MAKDNTAAPSNSGADGGALSEPQAPATVAKEGKLPLETLRERVNPQAWAHAAASALHGWKEHAYHEGAPIALTEADYRGALEATLTGSGDAPFAKALSPHRGKGF